MIDKVLFFSRDPGAANFILALHRLFSRENFPLCIENTKYLDAYVLAKDAAINLWKHNNVACHEWPDEFEANVSVDCIKKWLRNNYIKHVVSGTSDIDDESDLNLWEAAKNENISVHVVLDDDSNICERFRRKNGSYVIGDYVYVEKNIDVDKLVMLGMKKNNIISIDNFHLNYIKEYSGSLINYNVNEVRSEWKIKHSEYVVLFASSSVREMKKEGRSFSFDEFDVLNKLISSFKNNPVKFSCIPKSKSPVVVIRPHPRDKNNKYSDYIRDMSPKVIVSDFGNSIEAISSSDVVFSISPAMHKEATALNKPSYMLVDWDNGSVINIEY